MNLEDKINRAFNKKGFEVISFNGGDIKAAEFKCSVSHEGKKHHLEFSVNNGVHQPKFEGCPYTQDDLVLEIRMIEHDSKTHMGGIIYPIPEKDLAKYPFLSKMLDAVKFSEEDLIRATESRRAAIESFCREFYPNEKF